MLEYAIILKSVASGFLDLLFDLDSVQGLSLIVLSGIALIMIGFLIKGGWGAIIALLGGIFSVLYIRLSF